MLRQPEATNHQLFGIHDLAIQSPRLSHLALFLVIGLWLSSGCDRSQPSYSEDVGAKPTSKDDVKSAESPSTEAAPSPTLTTPEQLIGQRPPAIHVAKWIKGEPLTEFEPGKIYVVDFWATWCGPCIAAIPHLTQLAQDNKGKVEVIGISIAERQKSAADTSYIAKVTEFVDKKGDRMDYRVAVDTPDKQMYATWFKPTGTGGIPTAYIIDQQGLVAWTGIGNPAVIDRIVHDLLEGKFDATAETTRQKQQEEEAEAKAREAAKTAKASSSKIYQSFPGYEEAKKNGDTAAQLAILNEAFAKDPTLEAKAAYQWKFMVLMGRNKPEEVNAYIRELLDRYPTNGDVLGFASACTVSTSEEPRFDKQLTLEVAKKSVELNDPDSRFGQFAKWRLAWAYHHIGDREKAVETMRLALDGINRLKATVDFSDLSIQCEDALKVFEK
jgi:thiol-disulfide isomerase/thioredoxin